MSVRVAFGLGANLGDRRSALQTAVEVISDARAVETLAVSPIYETDPVGGPDQPEYFNAVLVANTELTPSEVLKLAQLAEQYLSRTREVRWGARTLDVDVLAYGPLITINEVLTLPHPRAVNRRFVLAPWAEIDPDFVISGTGKTVASALASLSTADLASVRRMQDMFLKIPDSPIVDS